MFCRSFFIVFPYHFADFSYLSHVEFFEQDSKKGGLLIWFCLFLFSLNSPDSLPLVYHVYRSEELLRWCLDHGARVDYADTDPPSVPPLLECVGKGGTVSAFKLLMKNGAKLGRRTLHRAVEGASSGAPERMDMVRFLVEEMGCDVNGMDMPEDKRYSAHYGTPLNYAAHKGGAVEVVMYLLEVSLAM